MKHDDLRLSAEDGSTLARRVEWAGTPMRRCRGLLGRSSLNAGRGMLLAPCRSVHTCFMRFNLDLIFIARDFQIVKIARDVRPWRFVCAGRRAWGVLEIESGWFPWLQVKEGDRLVFEPSPLF